MGRKVTFNDLRQRSYWIIGGTSVVSNLIAKCVICKRFRGSFLNQNISDLPKDSLEISPPFCYSAVDIFGSFTINEKRSQLKLYGVLSTCQASRSVHLVYVIIYQCSKSILKSSWPRETIKMRPGYELRRSPKRTPRGFERNGAGSST